VPSERAQLPWLALVYGSLAIPFVGPLLLAVVSSVLYFRWRKTDPVRAAWVNRHAWIAAGLNTATNVGLLLLTTRRHPVTAEGAAAWVKGHSSKVRSGMAKAKKDGCSGDPVVAPFTQAARPIETPCARAMYHHPSPYCTTYVSWVGGGGVDGCSALGCGTGGGRTKTSVPRSPCSRRPPATDAVVVRAHHFAPSLASRLSNACSTEAVPTLSQNANGTPAVRNAASMR
jgi:hypothetical protein